MSDVFKSAKDFSNAATLDLTDEEIRNTMQIIVGIQRKYAARANTPANLEMLRDEVLTRLQSLNILATVDPAPCFYGEPPIVEIIGKINTDPIHKYGFDHERKKFEVERATDRGEDFLGQKMTADSTPAKKRAKNSRQQS